MILDNVKTWRTFTAVFEGLFWQKTSLKLFALVVSEIWFSLTILLKTDSVDWQYNRLLLFIAWVQNVCCMPETVTGSVVTERKYSVCHHSRNASCSYHLFSLLTTDRINLCTNQHRKCHKPEPVGIFYAQWLWSRIRDRTNDCLWSLQPIRKPTQPARNCPVTNSNKYYIAGE